MKNFLKEKLKENSEGMWLSLELVKEDLDSLNLSGKVSIKVMLNAPYVSIDEIKDLLKNSSKQNNLVNLPCGQNPYNALNYNKDSVIKNSATKNSVAEGAGWMKNKDTKPLIKGYISRSSAVKGKPFLLQIFEISKESGKRKRKILFSQYFCTEEEANEKKTSQLARCQKGTNVNDTVGESEQKSPLTKKTVEEYTLYLLNRGVKRAETETLEGYRYSAKPLLKVDMGAGRGCFGNLKLKNVSDDDVMFAFRKLSGIQAQSSLQKTFFVGKMVFSEAAQKGHINSNPFSYIKCPQSKLPPKSKLPTFSEEEMTALLHFAHHEDTIGELPIIYPMLAVLESTGMRPGELRGLMWSNVDFEKRRVHVEQSIVKELDTIESMNFAPNSIERVGKTKSKYSVREIPLSNKAIDALKEWQSYLDSYPLMQQSKFVFPNNEGSFRSATSNNSLMRRFIARFKSAHPEFADLEFNLYKFRHTFCTKLVLKGIPRDAIQRLMGDNNASVIQQYYTHITDNNAADMAQSFYDDLNVNYDG